jgi:hypothetical protein
MAEDGTVKATGEATHVTGTHAAPTAAPLQAHTKHALKGDFRLKMKHAANGGSGSGGRW